LNRAAARCGSSAGDATGGQAARDRVVGRRVATATALAKRARCIHANLRRSTSA
jgi:hypothetical protein